MILIEKDKAIDAIGEVHPLDYNARSTKARIEQLPTIEIVRCRECKHRIPAFGGFYMCKLWNQFIDDDFFCADGERRREDEET